jgi:hypothetical protein
MMLLPVANKKLLDGVNSKLEIAMGMKKTKDERPFESSAGESLKVNATVSSNRNRKEAYLTEN